jgi:glycosyltransferase involved in cell wall biosynthesis
MPFESRLSLDPNLSILVPVYEEGENIEKVVRVLECLVRIPHELLVVYDRDNDDALPILRQLCPEFPNIRLVRNAFGTGVVNAVKTGFMRSDSEMVCLFTGDFTDQPEAVNAMVKKMAEGYDLVSGARYIKGGRKYGGPWLQTKLSRWGNWLFHALTDCPLTDITYSFKIYRRRLLDAVELSGQGGWVMSMEIGVQAWLKGFKMAEIPTVWVDRQLGESRFRLWKWLPVYAKWFLGGIYEINRKRLARALGRKPATSGSA